MLIIKPILIHIGLNTTVERGKGVDLNLSNVFNIVLPVAWYQYSSNETTNNHKKDRADLWPSVNEHRVTAKGIRRNWR